MKKEKKKLNIKDFNHIYSKVPRLCVDLFLINKDGFLLTKRKISPDYGKWHFSGGTIRFQESLKEAVKRIAKSELGIKVRIIKQIGNMEFLRKSYHNFSVVFLVKKKSGKIKLDFQASEFKFFKKIPRNTVGEHAKFIRKISKKMKEKVKGGHNGRRKQNTRTNILD